MEALLCKRLGDPTSSSEPPIELTQNHPIPKLESPTAKGLKCDTLGADGSLTGSISFSDEVLSHRGVLLVLGAAGGAVVIAVARGDEKVQLLKSLGVDHVVDLMNQDVTASIKEFLKSRNLKGVDVLYDPVGGNLAKETRKLLNWGAQILVIGFASGEIPVIPANIILVKVLHLFSFFLKSIHHIAKLCYPYYIFKQVSRSSQNWIVHGFYWGSYRIHQPAVLEDSVRELISWMEKGLITVHISHTYSLSKVRVSHQSSPFPPL
ncbi:hypothetical protein Goshw_018093 [Gossypium schwendimanii]|uniref:Alcohol dehydrogenase-like C-terminal domain-containing protein n=1 Tax=Gossypium schwendimanii TaxID=34291 RepID=A0A7J9MU09_GOSSC|nr:hypothetical protein [Gossypium schwendimanii]